MNTKDRHIYVRPTFELVILDRQIVCQGTSKIPTDPNEHNDNFNSGGVDINFGGDGFNINGSAFNTTGRIFNNDSPF